MASGVERIYSVDLHPYLSEVMTKNDMAAIQASPDRLKKVFGAYADSPEFQRRAKILLELDYEGMTARDILSKLGVEYCAPGDAADLEMEDATFDLHVSVAVLEHIPGPILEEIFREGVRVTKPGGWFVHRWDMSDHFSHKDSSITAVNFLQFVEKEWSKYNDNRYMYVNRLRVNYFDRLFANAGLEVKKRDTSIDECALAALKDGSLVPVDGFEEKSPEVNATTAAVFFAQR